MTTVTRTTILILFFGYLTINGQNKKLDKDSMFAAMDARKAKTKLSLDSILVDSIQISGTLLDFDLGTTCGYGPGAGVFLFKLNRPTKIDNNDKVFVIIQCAHHYAKDVLIGQIYDMTVTRKKYRKWLDINWGKYPDTNFTHLFLTCQRHSIRKHKKN